MKCVVLNGKGVIFYYVFFPSSILILFITKNKKEDSSICNHTYTQEKGEI